MKEEALAPFCHFEQQEQQLKVILLQISELLIHTGNFQNYQILYWLLLLLKDIKAFRLIGFN